MDALHLKLAGDVATRVRRPRWGERAIADTIIVAMAVTGETLRIGLNKRDEGHSVRRMRR